MIEKRLKKLWDHLQGKKPFNRDSGNWIKTIHQLNAIFDSASDTKAQIAKIKMHNLAERLGTEPSDVCRHVVRLETKREESEILPLMNQPKDILIQWRQHLA